MFACIDWLWHSSLMESTHNEEEQLRDLMVLASTAFQESRIDEQ
jgi:hypothetical protein